MKFTKEQNKVLSEIYRRLNYFHNGNLDERLQMLVIPSIAKPIMEIGLIYAYSTEIPDALNWYELTEKGKQFFSNYVTKNQISGKMNAELFSGKYVKTFNADLLKNMEND